MSALKAYLVLPWDIEIVLVAEAGSLAEAKLGERDIRRPSRQLQGAEPPSPERELEQVDALPAHRDLDDTMQLMQCHAGWHLNPTPDHGTDPEQPHLELQKLWRTGCLGFGWDALWQ
jgi:hypothetical protein